MILTNRLNFPDALVKAVANDPYDNGGAWRSVTQLIAPPRQVALRKQYEDQISEDVAERLYSLQGQIIHSLLERANLDRLVEGRLFTEVLGKKISGQFDSFDVQNGVVSDWKYSTAWKAKELSEDWLWQMNLLAVLLRRNGHPVSAAEVVLLMRDHSKLEAKRDAAYPQLPILRMPVPLWPQDTAEAFLKERVLLHLAAETTLPECTPQERWAKPDIWAVMAKGRVTAVRLFTSKEEAELKAKEKPEYYVQFRPGVNIRCESYCAVSPFCSQFRHLGMRSVSA